MLATCSKFENYLKHFVRHTHLTLICPGTATLTILSLACKGLSQMQEEAASVSLEGEGREPSSPTWGRRSIDTEQWG